jgi:4-amino-4-deoxy-L-arabinose transferase-like glycosyltransferase
MLISIIVFIGGLWRVFAASTLTGFSRTEIGLLNIVKNNNLKLLGIVSPIEYLYAFKIKALYYLFRDNVLLYRLSFSLLGVITILFFFIFVRSWYNKQIALISTLLFATNYLFIVISETMNPQIFIITLILFLLYILSLAYREKSKLLFILSGLIAGIGIFINPIFIVFGFVLIFMVSVLFLKNKKFITGYLKELALMLTTISVFVFGYIMLNINNLGNILNYFKPQSFASYYLNVGQYFLGLISKTNELSELNVGYEPILDPLVATCLICGLIYGLFHLNKKKHLFLIVWFIGSLFLVSLMKYNFINYSIIAIPCFIIAGALLDYVLTNWTRTFPFNKGAKLVMTFVFSIFIFLSVFYNYQKFFFAWQKSDTIKESFNNTLLINKE